MTSRRTLALMIVPPLAVTTVVVLAVLSLDLPERIVLHWSFDGADRYGSARDIAWPLAILVPLITALMVGIVIAMTRGGSSTALERVMVGVVNFVGIGVALSMLGTALAQRSGPDLSGTSVAGWVVAGFGVALVLAVGLAFLTKPVPPVVAEPTGAPALDLGSTERASWSRSVTPSPVPTAVFLAAVIMVTAIMVIVGAPPAFTIAVLVILAAVFSLLIWRVRVDGRGLLVRSALGIPRFAIAPAQIVEARPILVNPVRQFGGWGIRLGASSWGVIVRGGEAVEVLRADGKPSFVVTVEDAATAAALLTAVARRATAQRPSPGASST